MVAVSPNNLYLSDLEKVYDYANTNVLFSYPTFPQSDNSRTLFFKNDNTIITSKAYLNKTYLFKMKIN